MPKETPVTNELEVIKKPRKPRAKKPTTSPAKAIATVKAVADSEPVVEFIEDLLPKAIPTPAPQNRLKNIPLSKAQRELASPIKETDKEATPKVKRTLSPIVAKGLQQAEQKKPVLYAGLKYMFTVVLPQVGASLSMLFMVAMVTLIVMATINPTKAEAWAYHKETVEIVEVTTTSEGVAQTETKEYGYTHIQNPITGEWVKAYYKRSID